jgi:hypothetical protein
MSEKIPANYLTEASYMTDLQIEAHEEAGEDFGVPVIESRCGGVSPRILNTCGICGGPIIRKSGRWIHTTERRK